MPDRQPTSTHLKPPHPTPGRVGYAVAALLVLLGLTVFAGALLPASRQVRDAVEQLQRIDLPPDPDLPAPTVHFKQPGLITVYDERTSLRQGQPFATPDRYPGPIPALRQGELTVTPSSLNAVTGRETSSVHYRLAPFAGDSLASYDLPLPGEYQLVFDEAPPDTPRILAFGHVPVELLKAGFLGIHGAAVTAGIAATAAAILALITWERRHPRRRKPVGPTHVR